VLTPGMLSELSKARAEALRAEGGGPRRSRTRGRRPGRLRLAMGTRIVSAGVRLTGEGR
jgi:hypothetical protein